jgi:pimeloyl-ACP methyl ester carboxylesterase
MPFVDHQGARIYWDEAGRGEPLLLLGGLGLSSAMWHRVRPALAARRRTITLDPPGVGRSPPAPGPRSIAQLAADAAAVLDAAGVDCAGVAGMSLGGMLALELALSHPARVRSLALGATAARRPVRIDRALIAVLATLTPENAWEALVPFLYHRHTPRERVAEDRAAFALAAPDIFVAQFQAIVAWDASRRLGDVRAPALVLHGDGDRVIAAENAERLARGIAGAKLVWVAGAGHLLTSDRPEETAEAIAAFPPRL